MMGLLVKSEKERAKKAGKALPAKGILVEMRGDWDWLNSWYNIPTYNTKSGMCWLCPAKRIFELALPMTEVLD